ncbi:MAG: hypothetical protein M1831_004953 [Alyxoria varia]|nr:MAG: hypothetical protein M1831_004953 [Alyxoria varia]
MDSMRSLNTSLPRSPSQRRKRQQPTSELLHAFKAAARSVTELYQTASTQEEAIRDSRDAGYREALDDLVGYLDQENLGLCDGEGWRVREWATKRCGAVAGTDNEAGETEQGEDYKYESSPPPHHGNSRSTSDTTPQEQPSASHTTEPPDQTESSSSTSTTHHSAPNTPRSRSNSTTKPPTSDVFHFQSSIPFPTQTTQAANDTEMADPTERANVPSSSVRVAVRPSRSSHRNTTNRHHNQSTRAQAARERAAMAALNASLGSLGPGAGLKRKFPVSEFFGFGDVGSGFNGNSRDRDGNGGGGSGGCGGSKKNRTSK